ncbi:aspartyl-phosphate phosphatase Spo0E family protein [Crassaminicella profunda]|uniref:aspartyl-phosphate phosphatase Spo0E family protein n=1 Tax=Crassaminicella profunda TaxID=1286698 RepID=UPI001CA69C87|nr:aspartyl-phosphate phosphatase Spo0E family protein [Crassaminicella profunda]QZY57207.1 aspartyl-phosphate phosphatase Spo0E family protein [Crassaminicella profunda]
MDNHKRKLNSILKKIENARFLLNSLIQEKKGNLLDPEVVKFSQFLDQLLSEYDHIKNNNLL